MSNERKQLRYPPTQQGLEYHCATQSIDQSECLSPEFRLELVGGQFLVGGTIAGSRWLLKEALIGWGLDAAIAFAPLDKWWEALRLAYEVPHQSMDDGNFGMSSGKKSIGVAFPSPPLWTCNPMLFKLNSLWLGVQKLS